VNEEVFEQSKAMHKKFTIAKFHQIPRKENTEANSLTRVALLDDFVDNPTKV